MLAWPHADTDWAYILDEVRQCYKDIARHIVPGEDLIVVTPDVEMARADLGDLIASYRGKTHIYDLPTNDTWARDFAPVTVEVDGHMTPLDYQFNAWGMKYAADRDNLVSQRLDARQLFKQPLVDYHNFVLEGGSIESDGNGTLMTTASCLLAPNRNEHYTRADIDRFLQETLGVSNIIWLDHGYVAGDDTDGHIDTLARFAPGNTIVYNGPGNQNDAQAESLAKMRQELQAARNAAGEPYRLLELPMPEPIADEDGSRLPATYANFLVMNRRVLVPTYRQPSLDAQALAVIHAAFPDREIVGIDCTPLIKQHGSLHCVTMQFPTNTLNL